MAKVNWERAKETVDAYKSGGIFLRLQNDGDKFVGAFVGEPCVRELYYDEKTKTYEKYTPKHRADGKKPAAKFSINVYQCESKNDKGGVEPRACRVFEMSAVTFKDLLKVKDKYGLDKWMFETAREGAKGSNKTTYHILPEEKLTDAQRSDIAELLEGKDEKFKLHDLDEVVGQGDEEDGEKSDLSSADSKKKDEKQYEKAAAAPATNGHANGANGHANGTTAPATNAPAPATTTEAPAVIAPEKSAELAARLKAHPNDDVKAFLSEFGVKKIKEVAAADTARAFAWLDKLEGKGAAPAEDDPFA